MVSKAPFVPLFVFLAFASAGAGAPGYTEEPGEKEDGKASEESGETKKPEEKPNLLKMFQVHYDFRVRSFAMQNEAWRNVVLVGDSITEGFDVNRYFPGRRVLNRGIGGDVIGNALSEGDERGVLRRLDSSVFDCAATDVFLLIGINDFNSGRSVDQVEAGYRELLSRIRERRPELRVHVQSLLPTRGKHDARNEPVREANRRIKKLAGEFGCRYLDLHALMRDGEGRLKEEFTKDGLHLTEPAYRVWQAEIEKAMGW